MIERQVKHPIVEKNGNGYRKDRRQSLTLDTKDKELSPWQKDAVNIIDQLMLDISVKKDFLIQFLAQSGDWVTIKKFREIREDFSLVAEKIIYDNRLVGLYENFHKEWSRNRAKELLIKGTNYHDIHEEYDIDRNELRAMRRQLYEEDMLKLNFLTRDHIRIKKPRDKGIQNKKIAQTIDIPLYKINEISGDLILAGLIDASRGHSKIEADKFRLACDLIVDLDRQGKGNLDIANKLNWSSARVSDAKRRLRKIGEIKSPRGNELAIQNFKEFLERLEKIEDENLTDHEIAKRMKEKEYRVRRGRRRLRKMGKAKIKKPEDSRRYYSRRLTREKEQETKT